MNTISSFVRKIVSYLFIFLLSMIVALETHIYVARYQELIKEEKELAALSAPTNDIISLENSNPNDRPFISYILSKDGSLSPFYNDIIAICIFMAFFAGLSSLLAIFRKALSRAENSEKSASDVKRQLDRSNDLFNQILENLPAVVFVKDVQNDYRVSMVNRAAEEFFGYRRDQMIGKTDYDLWKKDEADFFHSIDKSVMDSGRIIDIPCEIVTTPNSETFCHTKKVPIYDSDGKPQYLVGVLENITERKRNEMELANYRENLEKIVSERTEKLRVAIQKAEDANRLKSEFLATMSHEIRSPMSGVIGMAELLLDTSLTHEQKGLTKTILSSGEVLLNIIEDILDFSKIEANKMELDPIAVNMLEIVDDVCMLYSTKARDKALEIAVRYVPGSEQFVYADPTRIRQILGNMINNAIKFTESGFVIVTVQEEKDATLPDDKVNLTFSIEDSGIGIDPRDQDRIFEKFSQANSSTTRHYGGTGLGLSICKNLIELMGGKISLQSTPRKGSTFSFTLPLTRNREEIYVQPNPPILQDLRVLIVDDLPVIRTMVSEQLMRAGMLCECAGGGAEALSMLETARENGKMYDIIIIDYLMPGMNGEMLARAINDEEDFRDICLIMLTAAGNPVATDSYAEKGFSAYISKPVRVRPFIETLAVVWEKYNNGYKGTLIRVDTQTADSIIHEEKYDDLKGTRILLVEDSRLNQAFAEEVLAQIECDVTTVSNGQEAILALEEQRFDLILMDCQMPIMDGFEASRHICRMKSHDHSLRNMPIIALTANAMKGDKQKCMDAGMDDYITKPVRKHELKEKIYTWVHANNNNVKVSAHEADNGSANDFAENTALILDTDILNEARDILKDKFDYMVDCYIEDVAAYLQEMKGAIEKHEIASLIRPAHTIKSTSKRMGAMALADIAKHIEKMGRDAEEEGHPKSFWNGQPLSISMDKIADIYNATAKQLLDTRMIEKKNNA